MEFIENVIYDQVKRTINWQHSLFYVLICYWKTNNLDDETQKLLNLLFKCRFIYIFLFDKY